MNTDKYHCFGILEIGVAERGKFFHIAGEKWKKKLDWEKKEEI